MTLREQIDATIQHEILTALHRLDGQNPAELRRTCTTADGVDDVRRNAGVLLADKRLINRPNGHGSCYYLSAPERAAPMRPAPTPPVRLKARTKPRGPNRHSKAQRVVEYVHQNPGVTSQHVINALNDTHATTRLQQLCGAKKPRIYRQTDSDGTIRYYPSTNARSTVRDPLDLVLDDSDTAIGRDGSLTISAYPVTVTLSPACARRHLAYVRAMDATA